jgi:aminoglycoside phosphotransferase (APT) family kinase protein
MTTADDPDLALLDRPNLEAWLDATAPQLGSGPLQAVKLEGGVSNAVFRVTRGEAAAVLRRPPRVPRPDSERTIQREAIMLKALTPTNVPAPKLIAYCEDKAVTGEKFYLMEFIDGWRRTGTDADPAPYNNPDAPEYGQIGYALLSGTEKLHMVDYKAVGLADFAKPDNFLERQVDRWLGAIESYKQSDGYAGRTIEGMDYLAGYLRQNMPQTAHIGILHGDYSFANSLYAHGTPPTLAAMIDWELCTIGDTLLDLGSVLYHFKSRKDKTPPVGIFDASRFPYREDLADHYGDYTGRSVEHLDYYVILAIFKLAAIMEGHLARALAGKSDRSAAERYREFVDRITAKAVEIARD